MKVGPSEIRQQLQLEISNLQLVEATEHQGVLLSIFSVVEIRDSGIMVEARDIISPFLVKQVFLSNSFSKYLSRPCCPNTASIVSCIESSSEVLICLLDIIELSDFIICNVWRPGYLN
ncbi:hypothetical protein MDAP_002084 [Mitosporidium daphniae]|uniref:Uncharacterized protein n=1 Tax=Mitosporidium daphniae TaxID=1485682 RepID=A0A098VV70_9MICR|nr:uncharacterized protein DI09_138p30 [Mitosporidium daphniae]KGG52759.1 hypothetical protein DI09_138p30 [Mitosporidium daphniae]|eukprot:XP_013239195.1 uncharacterized protein DI09_138p30 [Mitosporidium daphniae]